jgi:branched-chain amino acid aminotransferase
MNKELYVNYNGMFHSEKEYVISPKNRAFRYGDGLFESIKFINGKALFFHDHYARMNVGMKYLKMGFDKFGFSEQYLHKEIIKTVEKNKASNSSNVRLQVFRNYGGKYTPTKNECSFIIEVEPIPDAFYKLNEKGLKLGIFEEEVKPLSLLSNFKTCNAMIYILAGLYKVENAFDDVLILNHKNTIAEAVSSNVFIARNDEFHTPPLTDGCVDGVMRKQVISLLKSQNKNVIERTLIPENLLTADEVFLTNTIAGITWVVAFKQKRYFNNHSRKLIDLLNTFHA